MFGLVLLMGGKSKRLNSSIPKQFIEINNYPIWHYALEPFLKALTDLEVVFVCEKSYHKQIEKLIFNKFSYTFAKPGLERQNSVLAGLLAFKNQPQIVFIHDAARPNPSINLINKLKDFVLTNNLGAIPGIQGADSLKEVDQNAFIKADLNRDLVYSVQTPQVFPYLKILAGYQEFIDNELGTDDAFFAKKSGLDCKIILGDENNFKITKQKDLVKMQAILEKRSI